MFKIPQRTTCDICSNDFSLKEGMIQRSIAHNNIHGFLCTSCGKLIQRIGHLNHHTDSTNALHVVQNQDWINLTFAYLLVLCLYVIVLALFLV